MKQRMLNIVRVLLLALFVSYWCGTSLLYHTHYFAWGTVTHSHPFLPTGDGMPGHSHTEAQCETLAQLSTLLFVTGLCLVSLFNVSRTVHFRPFTLRRRSVTPPWRLPSRAPPAWA